MSIARLPARRNTAIWVATYLLSLLLLLLHTPAASSSVGELPQSSKQIWAVQATGLVVVENATAAAAGTAKMTAEAGAAGDEATVADEAASDDPVLAIGRKSASGRRTRRRSGSLGVVAAKSTIIRDFVREHGATIQRSRRHADLFDGSGYLIDAMEELTEFETRAQEEHQSRKRRSTNDGDNNNNNNNNKDSADQDWRPDFASLSEALDHVNGGAQGQLASGRLNLRFFEAESEEKNEEKNEEKSKDSRRHRRRRRSSPDADEDDDGEEDYDREKEAEQSLQRLDEMLMELAKFLDREQAAEGAGPLANFNRRLGEAHQGLTQLRSLASGLLSRQPQQQQQQQQQRMPDLFPDKSANWRLDAADLRDNVRQLERFYRRMDEL